MEGHSRYESYKRFIFLIIIFNIFHRKKLSLIQNDIIERIAVILKENPINFCKNKEITKTIKKFIDEGLLIQNGYISKRGNDRKSYTMHERKTVDAIWGFPSYVYVYHFCAKLDPIIEGEKIFISPRL